MILLFKQTLLKQDFTTKQSLYPLFFNRILQLITQKKKRKVINLHTFLENNFHLLSNILETINQRSNHFIQSQDRESSKDTGRKNIEDIPLKWKGSVIQGGFRRGDRNGGNEGLANEVSAASAAQDANNNNARDKRGWRRNGRSSETSGTGSTTGSTTATYTRRKKALPLFVPLPFFFFAPPLLLFLFPRRCTRSFPLLSLMHAPAILPAPLLPQQEVEISFLSNGIRDETRREKGETDF